MKKLNEVNTKVITSSFDLDKALDACLNSEAIALDTETDGLTRFRKVIGISIAPNENEAYYIPTLIWDGNQLKVPWKHEEDIKQKLFNFFEKCPKLIMHNAPFDVIAIDNYLGIDLRDKVYSDTKLLHHTVINEEPPHSLKPLAVKHIGPDADSSQKDLEEDVKSKGGKWTKEHKEFFRADPFILGKYACMDVILTYRLHNLFYPEIEKQKMQTLWYNEVLPLNKVITELNSTGIRIDVPYFQALEKEVRANVVKIENDIYEIYRDQLQDYETDLILEKVNITERSALGKHLKAVFVADTLAEIDLQLPQVKNSIVSWYKEKHEVERIFNIDSNDDKAHLLFNVIGLESLKTTKGGKQAVDKKTLEALFDLHQDQEVVRLINTRAKEKKLLTTYIEPLLANHIDGRVYPQFNQTGTTSGRFTSSEPINFQTLPRDDLRIKKGFIPDEGYVFVNADFSSLEPRAFVAMSNEPSLKEVYAKDLDLYSQVYIDMWNAQDQYSAEEDSPKYLKKLNPGLRNLVKPFVLGAVYGLKEYKLSTMLTIPVEEARDILDKYFTAYPNLKKYMDNCDSEIATFYEVKSLMGRKRRATLIPLLKKHFPNVALNDFRKIGMMYNDIVNHPAVASYINSLKPIDRPKHGKDLSYMVRNEFNNSKNFKIQSLAASIANASTIGVYEAIREHGLDARLILQVHDEITLLVKKQDAERASKWLKFCMEHNDATSLIDVSMKAVPIIATNLAEAK